MKKIIVSLALLIALSSCVVAKKTKNSLLPSDVIAKKQELIGKTGTVSGYMSCATSTCSIYDKIDFNGSPEGAFIIVTIDKIPSNDKKTLLTTCSSKSCAVNISGKFYLQESFNSINLDATSITIDNSLGISDINKVLNFL